MFLNLGGNWAENYADWAGKDGSPGLSISLDDETAP